MVLLLKLRVLSLSMGVLDSSYIKTVGVKNQGLKRVFFIFSDTLICRCWFFLSQLSVAHRCRPQQLVKVLSAFSKVKLVAIYSTTRFKDLKARIETNRWFWCPFVNEEGCEEKFLDKYNLFHQFLSPPLTHTYTLQGRQNWMPNKSLGKRCWFRQAVWI